MEQSTAKSSRRKAAKANGWAKPYADFPLSYHPPSRRLYKRIRGKRWYLGYASDWQSALAKYQLQRDDLHAGRAPRESQVGLTVADLCNRFYGQAASVGYRRNHRPQLPRLLPFVR